MYVFLNCDSANQQRDGVYVRLASERQHKQIVLIFKKILHLTYLI